MKSKLLDILGFLFALAVASSFLWYGRSSDPRCLRGYTAHVYQNGHWYRCAGLTWSEGEKR